MGTKICTNLTLISSPSPKRDWADAAIFVHISLQLAEIDVGCDQLAKQIDHISLCSYANPVIIDVKVHFTSHNCIVAMDELFYQCL